VLNDRIEAQIVIDAIRQLLLFREIDHLLSFYRRHTQRLLTQHRFSGFECCLHLREMQRIGCTDMDGFNGGISQQFLIRAGGPLYTDRRTETSGFGSRAGSDGGNIHMT
jgi:hypothetical protein